MLEWWWRWEGGLGVSSLLVFLVLHPPLLVEDLLGLPVADEQDDGGKDEDDGGPGCAVAEPEGVDAGSSCNNEKGDKIFAINFNTYFIKVKRY